MFDKEKIRQHFNQTDDKIYFNADLIGFPPKTVWQNTIERFQALQQRSEKETFVMLHQIEEDWKSTVSDFIGCEPHEVIGIPNTTTGLNLIATSMPFKKGRNIVTTALEFVNAYIPFQHQCNKLDLELRIAKVEDWAVPSKNILDLIDQNTQLVALSHVAFLNGFRHELTEITHAAHSVGALVCLDCIQSLGALVINAKELDVDMIVSGSSKWLMATPGWGILYVNQDIITRLSAPFVGFMSLQNPMDAVVDWTEGMDFIKNYPVADGTIDKFKTSTENIIGKISVIEAMNYLNVLGMEQVEQEILSLTNYLISQLDKHNITCCSAREDKHRSGIVLFDFPKGEIDLVSYLEQNNIFITKRGGYYRISCHIYNTRKEIDRLINILVDYSEDIGS